MRRTKLKPLQPLHLPHFHGHARYLTVYAVTRHYGGPEEGGWWYNVHEPIFSTGKVLARRLNKVRERLFKQFSCYRDGDIYSVLGGMDIDIVAERTVGQYATRHHPRYE